MNFNSAYRQKCREILDIEEKTKNLYKYYLRKIEDSFLVERLKEIYNDEEKHVELARNMLCILSKIDE